jgi:hypothetical protein
MSNSNSSLFLKKCPMNNNRPDNSFPILVQDTRGVDEMIIVFPGKQFSVLKENKKQKNNKIIIIKKLK